MSIPNGKEPVPPGLDWTLGWRLRRSAAFAGIELQSMAEYLEVSKQTISRWTRDEDRPKRVFIKAWAERTGVPLDWLEDGDTPKNDGGQPVGRPPSRTARKVDAANTTRRTRRQPSTKWKTTHMPMAAVV
jgi:transcriptional regulator with XRE-family HTH domain